MLRIFVVIVCATLYGGVAHAGSPSQQLNQMVEQLQQNPTDNALRENIIKFSLRQKYAPAVPEEARGHFVKAVTLLKEATTETDYDLPIQEYRKALLIAPWWSDAYYNLGIALELKQQYAEAIVNLKLSLMADPRGPGARAVQDKIYAVEAEQEKAAGVKAAEQAAKARQDAVYAGLDGGVWKAVSMDQAGQRWDLTAPNQFSYTYIEIHGHEMSGYFVQNPNTASGRLMTPNEIGVHLRGLPATTFSSRQFIIPLQFGDGGWNCDDREMETMEINISQDGQAITTVAKCSGTLKSTTTYNRIR